MNVLIITHSADNESIPLMAQALEARGATPWRFDTDRFPTELPLSLELGPVDGKWLETPQGRLDLSTVEAVWYRRLSVGSGIPKDMEGQLRQASVEETRRVFFGMLHTLPGFQLDPYLAVRYAENKQLQLEVARQVGLIIPDSLTTNAPDAVRRFAAAHPRGIITKMLSSFAIYEDGQEKVVFTTPFGEEELADLEGLELCPMTFQERLEKACELRVTVAGSRIFAAAIDSQASERAKEDWRRDGVGLIRQWKPYELPLEVAAGITRLMDYFCLNYGALDFIVTPDGRHVFLEVNPAGEFFWLQLYADQDIAGALADVLTARAPRRHFFGQRCQPPGLLPAV